MKNDEKINFVKQHPIRTIILIALLPYLIVFLVYLVKLSSNIEHWGQAGDFFGGMLNPIYSFFALIALFLINKEQLKDNKKQSEVEKFENNFFNMLDMLKSLLKDLREEPKENTLDSILSEYIELGEKTFQKRDSFTMLGLEITSEHRLTLGIKETSLLDNIFRLLYQILKFIYYKYPNENGNSNINERRNYSDIVRSFLPEELFWLLAINASINKKEYFNKNLEEYHKLIVKFAFLEDIKCEGFKIDGKIELYYEILFNYDMEAFGDLKNVKYTMKFLNDGFPEESPLGIEKYEKLASRVSEAIVVQSNEKFNP